MRSAALGSEIACRGAWMNRLGNGSDSRVLSERVGPTGLPYAGNDGRWPRKEWLFRAVRALSRFSLAPLFRLEKEGLANLPRHNAFILLPKHRRWEDIPLLALATPRPLYYVAKHELFANPLSHWLLRSLGGIPLNRRRPLESRRSLQAIIDFLREGEGVVVFPEGTYYRNNMGPGHSGILRLILSRMKLPFVPVGLDYSASGLGMRTLVRIRFGQPVYEDPNLPANEFLQHIMKRISALSGF